MPDSFEFTIAKPTLELGQHRTDSVVVDVTSRLASHGLVRVEVRPGETADATWFGEPDPVEFDLPSGETLRTTIPIAVPADAAAGDYTFELRAYAVADPQQDFANSPSIAMKVPEPSEPSGIPSWIFLVIGALVLLVIAFAVYFLFFRGGDDEAFPDAPNLIALTPAEAEEELAETQQLEPYSELADPNDGCIMLQTPPPGTPAVNISALVVSCPTPAPNIVAPDVLAALCDTVAGFCEDNEAFFGEDFADDPEWIAATTTMTEDFVDAFRTEGVEVDSIIGLTEADAIDALEGQGFLASPAADGSGGAQCALLQHPFPGTNAEDGAEIRLVTTRCPAGAETADTVVLNTTIDVDTFANLCDVALTFCNSIRGSDLGPGYIDSEDFEIRLNGMVVNFRNAFTGPVVPDVTTLSVNDAVTALEAKGLTAAYAYPPSDSLYLPCYNVSSQNPTSGTLISTMSDDVVALQLVETLCWVFPQFPFEYLVDANEIQLDLFPPGG